MSFGMRGAERHPLPFLNRDSVADRLARKARNNIRRNTHKLKSIKGVPAFCVGDLMDQSLAGTGQESSALMVLQGRLRDSKAISGLNLYGA